MQDSSAVAATITLFHTGRQHHTPLNLRATGPNTNELGVSTRAPTRSYQTALGQTTAGQTKIHPKPVTAPRMWRPAQSNDDVPSQTRNHPGAWKQAVVTFSVPGMDEGRHSMQMASMMRQPPRRPGSLSD